MTILSDRDITDEERAAIDDEPRPGVWLEAVALVKFGRPIPVSSITGKPVYEINEPCEWRGDGSTLSQIQTDVAIASELYAALDDDGRDMLLDFTNTIVSGTPIRRRDGRYVVGFVNGDTTREPRYSQQRGGIHSDPLVRLLAFRAWGDRDRAWRKRDTAMAIAIAVGPLDSGGIDRIRVVYGFDGMVDYGHEWSASVGDRRAVAPLLVRDLIDNRRSPLEVLLDCLDELDAKLAAGGEPVPSGPLTFDLSSSPR